jgi:hypothetical protein
LNLKKTNGNVSMTHDNHDTRQEARKKIRAPTGRAAAYFWHFEHFKITLVERIVTYRSHDLQFE